MAPTAELETKKRKKSKGKPEFLIVLDMNGVLILRKTLKDANHRPYFEEFIEMLWSNYPRLNVGVWSSMMPHNLQPLVQAVFGERAKDLAFVYGQDWCHECWVEGMKKPLLRKDLVWLGQTEWHDHYWGNRILLVDDDPIKCTENEEGCAVHPLTWEGDMDDTELQRLGSYISALAQSDCTSVPEFTLQYPYENYSGAPATPPRAKRARTNTSAASVEYYSAGEDVEAYWPDDGTWLPAKIVATERDGSVRIHWDGSESIVPAEYVRYPSW